jgi:hypothetical protein
VRTPQPSPPDSRQTPYGPLATCIFTLAGTPDDVSGIDTQLDVIAQLAADTLPAVTYAAITAVRTGRRTTVAASSGLAVAVDQALYAEHNDPCPDALNEATPVGVPSIAAMIDWPGFGQAAARMGLHTSLPIPLFAASGTTIAALNLYSREPHAMTRLTAWVRALYRTEPPTYPQPDLPLLDAGGQDLIAGLIEAIKIYALLQRAVGVLMEEQNCSADRAYLVLRVHAVEAGISLPDTATALLGHLRGAGGEPYR